LVKVSYNYGTVIFQFFAAFSSNSERSESEINVQGSTSLVSYNLSIIRSISLGVKIEYALLSVGIRGSYNFWIPNNSIE
jgi:hypothetical protein